MFNSYGWIQLGINRKGTNFLDEDLQIKIDKLDNALTNKVLVRLNEIQKENEILKFDFTRQLNNLHDFLTIQISRNHFTSRLREFYMWIAEISDGSHGVLYEFDDEAESYNSKKPYKIWRLIGNEFEECEELILNEKYHTIDYL